jgi:hypothetical protein
MKGRHGALAILAGAILLLPAAARARTARESDGGPGWIVLRDDVPALEPNVAQKKYGFILFRRSPLERIYQDSRPRAEEIAAAVDLQATRGEYAAAQVGVYALRELKDLRVSVSDLRDGAGHVIAASEVSIRMVRFYGARLSIAHPDVLGVVPKTLEVAVPVTIPGATVRPYWITVHVPREQAGGVYRGALAFEYGGGRRTMDLGIEVVPLELDEPAALYGTLCVNVLANLWKQGGKERPKVGPGAPQGEVAAMGYLQTADLIFRDQREHGATTISLRSGSHYEESEGRPYLADLEAAIGLYKKYGFTQPLIYCAGQLLRTNKINRSLNYKEYDPAVHLPMAQRVAAYYTQRFRDEGLPGIAFMPVEEPNRKSGVSRFDPPDTRRRLATTLIGAIKEAGGITALTCTPESVTAALDDTDYWIVAYRKFAPKLYDLAKQHRARLAIYANATVMGQGTYFSRFLFGYFVWANRLDGMLPWTYPVQPKRFPTNVGGRGEGGLNVRNEFLGLDGRPIPTVQWELSRVGIDDARYLATIERLADAARAVHTPAAAAAVAEADHLLAGVRGMVERDVRHYTFEDPRTFAPRPQDGWDAARFDAIRRQSVAALQHLLTALPQGLQQERPGQAEPTGVAPSVSDSGDREGAP